MLSVSGPAAEPRRRRAIRRSAVVVLAGALLAGAVACGTDPAPPAAPPPAVGDTAPPATSDPAGTTEVPSTDAADSSVGEIGEDDAFPQLGTKQLDVDDYELVLDYDPDTGELDGIAQIRAELAEATGEVVLDFQGLDVERVSVDGDQVSFEQTDDKLVVDLGGGHDAGRELLIVVDYSGVPEPVPTEALDGVEVGWHGNGNGSFVLSEPEGASTWYPVNNHPLDKATYSFEITVPDPYSAIANGELVSKEHDEGASATTFEWRMDAPMASYLASVVTGEFYEVDGGEHDGVSYSYWYEKGTDPSATLSRTDELVAMLADRLGPFPFATYGGVVYPSSFINGGSPTQQFLSGVALEVQGRSLFSEGSTVPSVIIHEAAHQWMGDNVSITDWSRDIWWVEGFAHFAEYIEDPDALADQFPEVSAQWQPPGDLPIDQLFFGCSYECGGMVFYALYREVGEDTFWEILREFNGRYYLGNASTDDLIAVASEVSGEDLTAFFDAWLFDETPPQLPA